jgi:hypothetical protein
MALDLHPSCRGRLVDALRDVLPSLRVEFGNLLSSSAFSQLAPVDSVLPDHGPLRDRLAAHIGDFPAATFFFQFLSGEVWRNQELGDSTPKPLTSIPEYSDAAHTAERIVQAFESLPWRYTLSIRLPQSFCDVFVPHIGEFELSDKLRIVVPDTTFAVRFPITAPSTLVDAYAYATNSRWEGTSCYLQAQIDGFVVPLWTTRPTKGFLDTVKTFAGLGVAQRLFATRASHEAPVLDTKYLAHLHAGDVTTFAGEGRWASVSAERFQVLALDTLDGNLDTPEKFAVSMRMALEGIRVAFMSGDTAIRVRLAARWLFDSIAGSDPALSFVQAAVVLEVLLGDELAPDKLGLSELLANRFAFLVAKTVNERTDLIKSMRELYSLRSQVVHRGKSELTLAELVKLMQLQRYCSVAIQKETKLLGIPPNG